MSKDASDVGETRRDEVLRRMLTTPKKPLYETPKAAKVEKEDDGLPTRRPQNTIKSG